MAFTRQYETGINTPKTRVLEVVTYLVLDSFGLRVFLRVGVPGRKLSVGLFEGGGGSAIMERMCDEVER